MDTHQLQEMASQLRQPHGANGLATGEMMNKGNAPMNLDALRVLNAEANDHILEIGMGNGFFVKDILVKHDSIQYTGCDFSELMVAEAEKMNAEWIGKGQAKFLFGDVAALPFDDGSFNKIFTVNTIYFWEDAAKNLAELRRVLSPGGKLFISLRPKHHMEKYPFTKYGFNMFSKEDVVKLLEDNGFTGINVSEHKEPEFVFNGETIQAENMVVQAEKL